MTTTIKFTGSEIENIVKEHLTRLGYTLINSIQFEGESVVPEGTSQTAQMRGEYKKLFQLNGATCTIA